MRRAAILNDLDVDGEHEEEDMYAHKAGARGTGRRYKSNFRDYAEEYNQWISGGYKSKSFDVALDKDLEDDRIGSGALNNLALFKGSQASEQTRKLYHDEGMEDEEEGYAAAGARYRSARYGMAETSYSSYKSKYGRSNSMSAFGEDDDYESRSSRGATSEYDAPSRRGLRIDDDEDDDGSYKSPYMSRTYGGGIETRSGKYGSSYSAASATSATSATASRYKLSRANTVNTMDYNFERPSGQSYNSRGKAESSYTTSRFLNKVREKKASGEEVKRDKPFKSRFLGKSFDSGYSSTTSSRASYAASLSTTPSDTSPSPDTKTESTEAKTEAAAE